MVVISAAVVTRSGKALVARQFVEIGRARIEGLLAAFPKLVGTGGKQHTFIETTTVRYVYQPMDDLYTVLITNRASNILEDLETLQLITNIVSDQCGTTVNENTVTNKAFELIFAFDEVIALGYKEKVNLGQVKQFLEMDSHEEKIYQMVQKNKEREALEEAKRRRKEIEREHKSRERMGLDRYSGMSGGGGPGAISSSGGMGGGRGGGMGGGYGGGSAGPQQPYIMDNRSPSTPPTRTASPAASTGAARKGLTLKKGPAVRDELSEAMKQEAAISGVSVNEASNVAEPHNEGSVPQTLKEDVHIEVKETLVVSMDRDGNLQQMEVVGELVITVSKESVGKVNLAFTGDTRGLEYKTHPNIDRQKFAQEGIIALKDTGRSYPLNAPTAVLKWRIVSNDSKMLPLTVSCWPNVGLDGNTAVTMEYELGATRPWDLQDVLIRVPIVAKSAPKVKGGDGQTSFDAKDSVLAWSFTNIDQKAPQGSVEFELAQWKGSQDNSHLFPINVAFNSALTFADLKVTSATVGGQPARFSVFSLMNVKRYSIE